MPKSHISISTPLREALIECFHATARLVRPEHRHQLVLVGGAASIAHSSLYQTEDVDVAAPPSVIINIWEGIMNGAELFSIESDGKIAYGASQGFRIRIDIIELGNGCIERIHVTLPFYEGSVASKSDLLRLRAVTVADRGSDGDVDDFRWLLWEVARAGQNLPELECQELEIMLEAGRRLDVIDRLILVAV